MFLKISEISTSPSSPCSWNLFHLFTPQDELCRIVNGLILCGLDAVDRMQALPTKSCSSVEKELFDSTNLAVRSSGHDLWSGRRGLQGFASPQNALNLKPCVVIYDGVCHLCNAGNMSVFLYWVVLESMALWETFVSVEMPSRLQV
jgi:hypothetical protein